MKRSRVLVVEADAAIGPLLVEVWEDLGAVVCAVEADVDKAVSAYAWHHPDLTIVDVGLGEAKDVAAIQEIPFDGGAPCVFVTDDNLRDPPLWPGATLVRKPFRAPEIVLAMQRAVGCRKRNAVEPS